MSMGGNCYYTASKPSILFILLFITADTLFAANTLYIISSDDTEGIRVISQDYSRTKKPVATSPSLAIWSEGNRDAWTLFTGEFLVPSHGDKADADLITSHTSRSASLGSDPGDLGILLQPPVAVVTPPVFRGWRLLSPSDKSKLLFPRPCFRRGVTGGKEVLPAAEVLLKSDSGEYKFRFPENITRLSWKELQNLPEAWQEGLPPGKYSLHAQTDLGPQSMTFSVESHAVQSRILNRVTTISDLLGADDPLVPLLRVETLLSKPPNPESLPYYADALDSLESIVAAQRSPYLEKLILFVQQQLHQPDRVAYPTPIDRPTGDKAIDEIRSLVTAGQWGKVSNRLDAIDEDAYAGERTRALAKLYRGVSLSESAFKDEVEANDCFHRALRMLESHGTTEDRYRVHSNYANFQANRALDRLHNQPFQTAAGVAHPLSSALDAWMKAADHYQRALGLAEKLNESEQTAVRANLARLHAILADALHALASDSQDEALSKILESSSKTTAKHASAVCESTTADPVVRALAESILGQLALRRREFITCRKHAARALQLYLEAGSLVGIESGYRLLGLAYHGEQGKVAGEQALRHLKVSWELGEFLRERYPAGQAGTSRAGFFARRAPLADSIVELLLQNDRPAEALFYVEQGRARSFQDLMSVVALSENDPDLGREFAQVLANWPKDVVALEYFLGSDKAWVFVIEPSSRVRAFPLVDSQGKTLASAEVIQKVRNFSGSIDHLLEREKQRVLAKHYDHSWQENLHQLYYILIPKAADLALKEYKTAVIVPQHLLHYFPFAALVTEPDRGRDTSEVPLPTFLVEEYPALIQVPSLLVWDRLRHKNAAHIRDVRAIGDANSSNLPGVAQDIENLKATFGGRIKKIHTGNDSHEANAKALLSTPGMVFFASHGQEKPDRPLEGHLVFQSGHSETENGLLTAAEIYAQPVHADLIVMSACYSGRADRSPLPGDDLFGLNRAFLQSGAKTVIGGLWDVYDGKAPELMQGVFQRLNNGEAVPQALAGSQREFLKKYRELKEPRRFFTHPYFWAVYSVWGDDRTSMDRN
jgi:CHAT domain-containing protein/tetratricopeptide (TPR) repeat protein